MAGRQRSRHFDALRANPVAWDTYRAYRDGLVLAIEQAEAGEGEPVWCSICRGRITRGKGRQRGDRAALSIDHVRRYSDTDPSTWDVSNLRPTHAGCNRRRRPGTLAAPAGEPPKEYQRW